MAIALAQAPPVATRPGWAGFLKGRHLG
jgi:hypothetical protein